MILKHHVPLTEETRNGTASILFREHSWKRETKAYSLLPKYFSINLYKKVFSPLTVEKSHIANNIDRRGRMVKAVVGDEA
jgi:hypothetical protein